MLFRPLLAALSAVCMVGLSVPADAAPRRGMLPPKEKALRIVQVRAIDDGSLGSSRTFAIDVRQGVCETDGQAPESEPFFDSVLGISILNTTGAFVRFTRFSYSVQNANGPGGRYNSARLALVGGGYVESSEVPTDLFALFLKAQDGAKFFTRSAQPIPEALGIRNVTVRLVARTATRQKKRLVARVALSFGDYDRCDSD